MQFAKQIIAWYEMNKRDLPWRNTSDPYFIWVSEVILQQTRVVQGIDYYYRFLQKFPTVAQLAAAPLDEVMRVWQGLGYYTRARNMHLAAQQIMRDYNGAFPSTYDALRQLRGVGDYTASAIGAFAFGIPRPAVDGNVYRVIARNFGICTPIDTPAGHKEVYAIAQAQLDITQAAVFNQAIMEFGATLCMPKNPKCEYCPLCKDCYAYQNDSVCNLPIKSKKTKVSTRYFTYLLILHEENTFVLQRIKKDIWHSLYEFPLIETERELSLTVLRKKQEWSSLFGEQNVKVVYSSPVVKHVLSHQHLYVKFHIVRLTQLSAKLSAYKCVPFAHLHQLSMPRVITAFLEELPQSFEL
ncbi:MAG: A/G-specific adenine glycosylase [Bacteroidales bacterium]